MKPLKDSRQNKKQSKQTQAIVRKQLITNLHRMGRKKTKNKMYQTLQKVKANDG
jgi:hypothetical protein